MACIARRKECFFNAHRQIKPLFVLWDAFVFGRMQANSASLRGKFASQKSPLPYRLVFCAQYAFVFGPSGTPVPTKQY